MKKQSVERKVGPVESVGMKEEPVEMNVEPVNPVKKKVETVEMKVEPVESVKMESVAPSTKGLHLAFSQSAWTPPSPPSSQTTHPFLNPSRCLLTPSAGRRLLVTLLLCRVPRHLARKWETKGGTAVKARKISATTEMMLSGIAGRLTLPGVRKEPQLQLAQQYSP